MLIPEMAVQRPRIVCIIVTIVLHSLKVRTADTEDAEIVLLSRRWLVGLRGGRDLVRGFAGKHRCTFGS